MTPNSPGLSRENAKKSLALAAALFPGEEWAVHEENIFVAKSRLAGGHKEQAKLYREISDARILTSRGSVAYFLPEYEKDRREDNEIHSLRADTVIDGAIVELKTISGNTAGNNRYIKNPALADRIVAEEATPGFTRCRLPKWHYKR